MKIEQNNNVQRFSAANAFRTSSHMTKPESNETDLVVEHTGSGTKTAPKNILDKVDTADIRKFAEYVGEYNITDDDIKYGLMYGRSVIAEWLC